MKDLRAYWRKRREVQTALEKSHPDGIYLASNENADNGTPEGVIVRVLPPVAAKCVVDNTHRPATAEEIEKHEVIQEARGESIREKERLANQQYVVSVPWDKRHEIKPDHKKAKPAASVAPAGAEKKE